MSAVPQETKPASSTPTTVQPRPSGYYTPAEVSQWQAVHGAGSFPPNYKVPQPPAPKGAPEIPKDTIYKGEVSQKQVQQDSLYGFRVSQLQQARQVQENQTKVREANVQQKEYEQNIATLKFTQESGNKEAPILPKQRTATSIDEAKQQYQQIISEPTVESTTVKEAKTFESEPVIKSAVKPQGKNVSATVTENIKFSDTEPHKTGREALAELQGSIKPESGEAVPLLEFPKITKGQAQAESPRPAPKPTVIISEPGEGTKQVPKTSILDPLQFFGLGIATKVGTGVKALFSGVKEVTAFFKEPTLAEVQARYPLMGKQIREPITPPPSTPRDNELLRNFNRDIQSTSGKGPVVYQTTESKEFLAPPKTEAVIEAKPFTSTEVKLGKGIGKGPGEGTPGTTSPTKPTPPPSSGKPSEGTKEIKTSSGLLIQKTRQDLIEKTISEQKQASTTEQVIKNQETEVKLGIGTAKVVKAKVKPQEEKLITIPKTTTEEKQTEKTATTQEEKQLQGLLPGTKTKPKETQKEDFTGLLNSEQTTGQGLTGKQTQTQGQGQPDLTPLISIGTFGQPTPPTKPPGTTSPTKPTPPQLTGKEPPTDLLLGDNKRIPFEKKKKGKGKSKEEFVGNAPLAQIVGLTKGEEVVYGKAASKRVSESFKRTKKNELVLGTNTRTPFLKPAKNQLSKETTRKKFKL